jgi:hypothetical protein
MSNCLRDEVNYLVKEGILDITEAHTLPKQVGKTLTNKQLRMTVCIKLVMIMETGY